MYKKTYKLTISLVIISMLINIMPLNLLAKELADTKIKEQKITNEVQVETKESQDLKSIEIKGELEEKRDRNIKEFLNSDNTITAAIYPYAVHYMKDGKWEDIDNSLVEISSNEGRKLKQTKSNNFKVTFAKNSSETNLINIKDANMSINWTLLGANKVNINEEKYELDTATLSKNERKTLVKNNYTTVTYPEILSNVDITYDVQPENVKEKIVLKNIDGLENKFKFRMDIGDLEAKLNKDKTIDILNKEGKEISKVESPFMYDGKLEFSDDVDVELTKDEDSYILELIPSRKWIEDKERAFPIVIDPTVNTSLYYQDIQDTFIYQGDSDNYTRHRSHILRVGGGISKITRALIKFTLPNINSGDQIIDAKLKVSNYPSTSEWTPWNGSMQIDVHKMTGSWGQEMVNWANSYNSYDPKIVDYANYQYQPSNPTYQNTWNITSIVKDWYVTGENNGLMLKQNTESITGHNEAYFLSADTSAASYLNSRPVVSITYRNQTGLEDYLTYESQSIGRAGTSYVNNYNGNLSVIHSDASTPGGRLPASIYHVYNTNDRTTNIGFGKGFRLNLSQTIDITKINNTEYARYIDEDGTRHYFLKQGTTNKYIDEDGLGLTLTLNSDGTFTMTDKGSNKLLFEKKVVNGADLWHLKEITDASNNKITITFLPNYPNNFYIYKVTDAPGSTLTLSWANGNLISIVDQNNKKTSYTYDGNKNLTTITYPDNNKSTYTYNSNFLITSIKNFDNSRIDYGYYNSAPYRVNTVKEYSSSGEIGNGLNFTYGSNETVIKDLKGNSNTYTFSNIGHAVSISDFGNNTNDISKAYGKMYQYGTAGGENNKLKLESKLMTPVINKVVNPSAEIDGSDWTYWYVDVDKGAISLVNNEKYFGNRSIKVVANGATKTSRMYAYQWVKLEKGKTYTLSTYIKTQGITNTNGGGARPFIYYLTANGRQYVDGEIVNGTSDWSRYTCTFTYPEEATTDVVVSLGITGENGTAYFDGIQVEEGQVANTYNLVENSGFDNGLSGWGTYGDYNAQIDKVVNTPTGNAAMLTGQGSKEKRVYQFVKVSGKKGDVFTISAWSKNRAAQQTDEKELSMLVAVVKNDGNIQWKTIKINADSSAWQYTADQLITDGDYKQIDIYLMYRNNVNEVYFDNIGIFKDEFGQSYTYDKDGNAISSVDMSNQNSTIQYNGRNELINQVNPNGGKYTYEYESKVTNRLLGAINSSGTKYSFEYDSYGNPTKTTVNTNNKVSNTIQAGKTYYIRSKSSGMYLDVAGAGTSNETKVQQYSYAGVKNQQWKVFDAGNGYVYLKPVHAENMALDTISTTNNVIIWTYNGSDNQKWKLTKNKDDSFKMKIKYQEATNCATIEGNSNKIEAQIKQEKNENKENQDFLFEEVQSYESENKNIVESGEIYYIKSKSSGLYLDYAKDGSGNLIDNNGTKLAQRDYNGNDSQKWQIIRKENGKYKLVPLFSKVGRNLTLTNGLNENFNTVEMNLYSENNQSQEWTISKNLDGTYKIASNKTQNTKYLSVSSNSQEEKVMVYQNMDYDNQKWYLESANMLNIEDNVTYKIKNINNGLYMGVENTSDINGANIVQNKYEVNKGQDWNIIDLKNGYYRFVAKHSKNNKVLDTYQAGIGDGTKIQLHDSNSSLAQQWEIIPIGDNLFSIKPRHTKGSSVLDAGGDGNKIHLWNSNGGVNQKFYLEKVSGPTTEYIESKATYKENGRFVDKITDALGNEVKYNYNFTGNTGSGTLKDVTDSKGNKTSYEYDNLDRITKTSLVSGSKTYENSYGYINDRISKISHNGFDINFEYDSFGNSKQVKMAGTTLVTNNYEANNGKLQNVVYGNNQKISYEYDRFSRVIKKTGTNGSNEYLYDARGNVGVYKDNTNNVIHKYTYDLANRIVGTTSTNGYSSKYTYDKGSSIDNATYKLNGVTNAVKYMYDNDSKLTTMKWDNDKYVQYNYDKLSRLNEQVLKSGTKTYSTSIKYMSGLSNTLTTSNIVSSITNGNKPAISYTYDKNGNIETIKEGTTQKQKYYYDELNQLIREDNKETNKTIVYEYDLGGNIQKVKTYAYTTTSDISTLEVLDTKTYTYDKVWKDKLTNYNGKEITYDEIGNPTSYDGNTYTWQNGRQLSKISKEGNSIEYKYNDSGIRTEKTVNGQTTKYYLEGDKVIYETTGTKTIYYTYDSSNNLVGFKYNNTQYYYIRNSQQDIVGILDNNLTQVVSYTYDTWGKLVNITDGSGNDVTGDQNSIGNINPYRYRGYRYDNETSMYYLQSRYYNPEFGRFINGDTVLGGNQDLLSYNLFAYCSNNPINNFDPTGQWKLPNWAKIVIGVAVIAVGVAITVVTGGAALPAIIAGVGAAIASGVIAASIETTTTVIKSVKSGDDKKTVVKKVVEATKNGFSDGFMLGSIMAGTSQVASGIFKTATNLGIAGGSKSGLQLSNNIKILSPNAGWHTKDIGGTLLKIGKKFRIDVGSSTLLHMHLPTTLSNFHIPIGTIFSGIIRRCRMKPKLKAYLSNKKKVENIIINNVRVYDDLILKLINVFKIKNIIFIIDILKNDSLLKKCDEYGLKYTTSLINSNSEYVETVVLLPLDKYDVFFIEFIERKPETIFIYSKKEFVTWEQYLYNNKYLQSDILVNKICDLKFEFIFNENQINISYNKEKFNQEIINNEIKKIMSEIK